MLERTEAIVGRYSVKKLFLEISQNSQENNFARDFFKLASGLQLYLKKSLAQVFSCEFGEISKKTFFYRTPPLAASEKVENLLRVSSGCLQIFYSKDVP